MDAPMSSTRIAPPRFTLVPSGTNPPRGLADTAMLELLRNRWASLRVERGGLEMRWWLWILFVALVGWLAATLINFEATASRSLQSYLAQSSVELIALGIGVVTGLGFRMATQQGRRYLALGLFALSMVFLVLVLVQGRPINGAMRWFDAGLFSFQPLELAKLGVILTAAWYFAPLKPRAEPWQVTVSMVLIAAVVVLLALLVLQPNYSGAALVFSTLFLLAAFTRQVPFRLLAIVALLAVLAGAAFILTDPERSQRVRAVISAQSTDLDIAEETYQITQARYAIARGGWLGVGPGRSEVKRTLPASESDFIFAILVEEYGVIGSMAILVLLFGAVGLTLYVSASCPDRFLQFVGFGIAIHWSLQILLSLQVNLGGITTGVPLPFFSKGGSAALTLGWEIALVALIASLVDQARRDIHIKRVNQPAG